MLQNNIGDHRRRDDVTNEGDVPPNILIVRQQETAVLEYRRRDDV